jgi:nucleoside-diphosphate-sugar epimerase
VIQKTLKIYNTQSLKKRILVTGASGFVGKRYLAFSNDLYDIVTLSVTHNMPGNEIFNSVDKVVHLAGLAHQMQKTEPSAYIKANFEKTKHLADLAKTNGVTHFIFISTIKVFGEFQKNILTEDSTCLPENDPYGESKLKAEQYLQSIADETFTVSIVRPPLIYGPGVKGNLDRILKLSDSGYFLPFGSIHNRRTMIYLDNLIVLINRIIETKAAGIFLAGDNRPISTQELVTKIRQYLGRPHRLFSIPDFFRRVIILIKPQLGMRLFSSLEMDCSSSYKRIGFVPPYSIEEGIKSMVDSYIHNKKTGNS